MKTLINKSIFMLLIICVVILNNVNADVRKIEFKNTEGHAVDDLHIVFDNNLVRDTLTGTFGNVRHESGTDTYNYHGTSVGQGNTATQTFKTDSGDIRIKEWWWTQGGNAFKDGAQDGKKKGDNGGKILSWNGGPAAGNGSVLVSIGGINAIFHTTPGYSTSQTCASFKNFIIFNYGPSRINVNQITPNKLYIAGNILGDSTQLLTVNVISQDMAQQLVSTPYVQMTLNVTAVIEGFFDITYNVMTGDYCNVYLRNGTPPYSIVDNSVTWLDSDGKGTSLFDGAVNGNQYYIDVKHRNSIETYSYDGMNRFISNQMNYDFTTGPNKAYGNNLKLKGSKWCIYSGDINQDGLVDAGDISCADNAAYNYITGYVNEDITGDELVDASDISITDNNAYEYVIKITPP